MQKIRVRIKGFDYRVVDKATGQICRTVIDTGAKIRGPVPLPNKTWKVAVHKGPHIDAKSKEHFGLTEHARLVDILEPNAKTIESLTHMQLPAGVDLKIS
ncbi:30S ribosomal protein S10 [uncultured bacterium]|nr:30S ribosomal protein S10 [Candidatus Dojkabacteria bacterium]CAG1771973.1 30S ribosomal protein S10 [uncultured bacterium]